MSASKFTQDDKAHLRNQLDLFEVQQAPAFPELLKEFQWQRDLFDPQFSLQQHEALQFLLEGAGSHLIRKDSLDRRMAVKLEGHQSIALAPTNYNYNMDYLILDKYNMSLSKSSVYHDSLWEWTVLWERHSNMINAYNHLIRCVTWDCNTPGQLKRLWPSLEPMLDNDMQRRLREAQKKSNLPRGNLAGTQLSYSRDEKVVAEMLTRLGPLTLRSVQLKMNPNRKTIGDHALFLATQDDGGGRLSDGQWLDKWAEEIKEEWRAKPVVIRPTATTKPLAKKPVTTETNPAIDGWDEEDFL